MAIEGKNQLIPIYMVYTIVFALGQVFYIYKLENKYLDKLQLR